MTNALVYVMLVFFVREGVPHARAEMMPDIPTCERTAREVMDGLYGDKRFEHTMVFCNTYRLPGEA